MTIHLDVMISETKFGFDSKAYMVCVFFGQSIWFVVLHLYIVNHFCKINKKTLNACKFQLKIKVIMNI